MTELQESLLAILKEFDGVCARRGLTYFAVGGTLLGAVRHRGFIPWDDDVDVALPRADYEALIANHAQWIGEGYRLKCQETEPGCPISFARFEAEGTLYEERFRDYSGYEGRLSIDVFPLDGAPPGKLRGKLLALRMRVLKTIFFATFATPREGRSLIKRAVIAALRALYDRRRLALRMHRLISRYPCSEGGRVANMLGSNTFSEMYGEIMPYEVYFPPRRYSFEDFEISGVARPHEYLTAIFGESYMQPPPESERLGKHPASGVRLSDGGEAKGERA